MGKDKTYQDITFAPPQKKTTSLQTLRLESQKSPNKQLLWLVGFHPPEKY